MSGPEYIRRIREQRAVAAGFAEDDYPAPTNQESEQPARPDLGFIQEPESEQPVAPVTGDLAGSVKDRWLREAWVRIRDLEGALEELLGDYARDNPTIKDFEAARARVNAVLTHTAPAAQEAKARIEAEAVAPYRDLLTDGLALIQRGDIYIEGESGEDGFIKAYRWPKVGSWHRILAWKERVFEALTPPLPNEVGRRITIWKDGDTDDDQPRALLGQKP